MTGSGTPADPYIIYDVDDLQAMENGLTAYYELANDIDASETSGWNGGAGFIPIGQAGDFTGQLDGKGHVITDLFTSQLVAGLFYNNAGVIQNLGLVNCDIIGAVFAAPFVAYLNTGTITKCYATGSVSGTADFGGGFVIINDVGGSISDCYSRCSVAGTSLLGGFVEYNYGDITNCYSTGLVSGGVNMAGFCTGNEGTITDCFWDTETSGQAWSDGGTGKTTAEMKTKSTFTDAGWDFTTPIWYISSGINNGYPAFEGLPTGMAGLNPALMELLE